MKTWSVKRGAGSVAAAALVALAVLLGPVHTFAQPSVFAPSSGSGAAQSPWTGDINAAGKALQGAGTAEVTNKFYLSPNGTKQWQMQYDPATGNLEFSNTISTGVVRFPPDQVVNLPEGGGTATAVVGTAPTVVIGYDASTNVFFQATGSNKVFSINGTVVFDGGSETNYASTNLAGRALYNTNLFNGVVINANGEAHQTFTTNATYNVSGFAGLIAGQLHVFSQTISNSSASTIYRTNVGNVFYFGSASSNILAIAAGKEAVVSDWILPGLRTNEVNALQQ